MPERIARVNLLPVPPGLAPEVAAMVEPLACCLHGVDRAGIARGRRGRDPRRRPDRADALRVRRRRRRAAVRRRRPRRSGARSRALFGAVPGDGRRRRRRDRGGRHRARRGATRSSSSARAAPSLFFGGLPRGTEVARRHLPPALRGADAARRVPPHAEDRPRARSPSSRAAPARGSAWSRTRSALEGVPALLRRPAARPAQGCGAAVTRIAVLGATGFVGRALVPSARRARTRWSPSRAAATLPHGRA